MRSGLVLLAAPLLILSLGRSLAQSAFDKGIGTDVDALVGKIDFDQPGFGHAHGSPSGKGSTPYLQALGHPPKRVALVSFYAYDPGNTHGFGSPYFGGRTETTRQLTADGAGLVATMLHDQGIASLKETFKAYGMEVLTPDEFLDTDAKRAFYENFQMELGAFAKFAKWGEKSGKENKLSNAQRLSAVAPGYRLFRFLFGEDPSARGGDKKIFKSLGYDLAKGLDVDATLVICNFCKATKKEGILERVYLHLFGPNGVPGEEGAVYWPGHLYVGLRLYGIGVPMLRFGESKKVSSSHGSASGSSPGSFHYEALRQAGIESEDYAGYERILAAFGKKAGTYMQEWTTKAKD